MRPREILAERADSGVPKSSGPTDRRVWRGARRGCAGIVRLHPGRLRRHEGRRADVGASLSAPTPGGESSPVSAPARAVGSVRTPSEAGLCAVCGRPLTGRRPQRVCSPRCRIACWRQTRARETAAEVAGLHAETVALRQRVAELERLVGQLKRRLWPRGMAPRGEVVSATPGRILSGLRIVRVEISWLNLGAAWPPSVSPLPGDHLPVPAQDRVRRHEVRSLYGTKADPNSCTHLLRYTLSGIFLTTKALDVIVFSRKHMERCQGSEAVDNCLAVQEGRRTERGRLRRESAPTVELPDSALIVGRPSGPSGDSPRAWGVGVRPCATDEASM